MKTNFRFSSKMHLFIIISAIVIAIGLAVGLACYFTSESFFNWGGDYSSYSSVTVQYSEREIAAEDVETICKDVFEENGVSYYTVISSGNSTNSRLEYRFLSSEDSSALSAAAGEIETLIKESNELGYVSFAPYQTVLGATRDIMYAGIALASAVVFQFLYFIIRYKLTMAFAAFVADVHNLALFYALLAITRVQVSSAVIALSVFAVLITMIGCAVLFDKMRKNFRTDEYKAMTSFEQSDAAARESFRLVSLIYGAIAVAVAIMLIFTAIGTLSVYGLFMPCICAIFAVLACEYGTTMFVPSYYARLKLHADKYAEKKASKYVGAKKTAKAAD